MAKIKSGELRPIPQNEKLATHHSIHDVDEMDLLDTESEMKVGEMINLLRARSFGDLGFANYKDPRTGETVFVNLRLSNTVTSAVKSNALVRFMVSVPVIY